MDILQELEKRIGPERILKDEPLSTHTTFRIGGPADYLVKPTEEEIPELISFVKEYKIPAVLIGNGSNLLVSDQGIRGVVIEIGSAMCEINCRKTEDPEQEILEVQAGALLMGVAKFAAKNSLTGLEFASGIPGNIGGALIMNAGAYGGEIKDVLKSITVLTQEGDVITYSAAEYAGGYRFSRPMQKREIVLHAELILRKGNPEQIAAKMDELKKRRQEKQPIEYPSAGSTFKRPTGYFAGKLVEDAGLKGYSVGGAQVSEKHCGFVINTGNATAADVYQLMQDVSRVVEEKYGILLEPEVRLLGEF